MVKVQINSTAQGKSQSKMMNPAGVMTRSSEQLDYSYILAKKLDNISELAARTAGMGFTRHHLEALEAGQTVLHAFTIPYHNAQYREAYKKAMGSLRTYEIRDPRQRRLYFDMLMAWLGAQMQLLKRMGTLIESSGILGIGDD